MPLVCKQWLTQIMDPIFFKMVPVTIEICPTPLFKPSRKKQNRCKQNPFTWLERGKLESGHIEVRDNSLFPEFLRQFTAF